MLSEIAISCYLVVCFHHSCCVYNHSQTPSYFRPPLPVLVPASSGQGLQISAQLIRKDGQIFYSMLFENNSQIPLDGFMIQFNKNTFGLAAGGPLQVITNSNQQMYAFCPSLPSKLTCGSQSGCHIATWGIFQHSSAHGFVQECFSWSAEPTSASCCEKQSATCFVLQG